MNKLELENEIQKRMDKVEKLGTTHEYIKKYNKNRIIELVFLTLGFAVPTLVLFVSSVICDSIECLIFAIVMLIFLIISIVGIVVSNKKPNEYKLKFQIKVEIKIEERQKKLMNYANNNVKNSNDYGEQIKVIKINAEGFIKQQLIINETNKTFQYKIGDTLKTYNFSDVINYEVYENGKSKVKGAAGRALIGGVFFGLAGAIIGGSASRKIDEKCTELKLIIRLNDLYNSQLIITYVSTNSWSKNSIVYKSYISNLQEVCSILEYMMNNKTIEENIPLDTKEIITKSKKDELSELKELLDSGLISQGDYDKKKNQILGIE